MSALPHLLLVIALLTGPDTDKTATIGSAILDTKGFVVHAVQSSYQSGTTQIRVLMPDKLEQGKFYPVIYVLPVEAGTENRYGDGLIEIQKNGLQNKVQAIFVAPTFSHLPWYADHPVKPEIRQETYFLKVVVPFVEKTYPVQADPQGRLLLGFSKSGWGAFCLLLRHPEVFSRAAAWDAPLMMDKPGLYGSGEIFATSENFELYRITTLIKERAADFCESKRLHLLGYDNFRGEHDKAHALMNELKILHDYCDGPARKHNWHSGWVADAVDLLVPKSGAEK